MSKIALDLRQFKHVKSDKNSTTLQHRDGHVLTVSHKSLSPESKAQLSALSGIGKAAQTPLQADEARHNKMASGGEAKVQAPAQKDPAPSKPPVKDDPVPANVNTPGSMKEAWNRLTHPMASGGSVESGSKDMNLASGGAVESGSPDMDMCEGGQPREMYADGTPDIGGVKQIVPERMPGPPVDYNNKLSNVSVPSDIGFSPEDMGAIIGHTINAIKGGAKAASKVASDVGQGVSQGVQQSSGVDLSGKDEEQPQAQAPGQIQPQQDQAAPAPAPQAAAPAPDQSAAPAPAPAQQPLPPGQMPAANMHATIPDATKQAEIGANQAIDAANQSGVAAGTIAEARAKASQLGADGLVKLQQDFHNDYNELNKERLAHIQDMQNGMIDPEKYWQNHSKIASGIGMILAGFNPTNNPNAAINYLKFQMEQNLDAQKQNLNAKNNILASTMQQFGNLKDATNMARIYQQDALAQQLLAAAPKAQNDQARLQIQQKAGELQQDSAMKLYNMAKDRQFFNLMKQSPGGQGSSGDPEAAFQQRNRMMNYFNPQTASYESERHVPGVGDAPIPVPEGPRSKMIAHQNFDNMAKRYQDFAQKHADNWKNLDIPERLKIQNEGASMGKELQSILNSTLEGGVSDAQRNEIEKILPSDPTKFIPSIAVLPKIKGLIDSNQSRYNTLKHAYHLPESKQQESQQEQIVTGKDGKQYRKVPGGYVPVR